MSYGSFNRELISVFLGPSFGERAGGTVYCFQALTVFKCFIWYRGNGIWYSNTFKRRTSAENTPVYFCIMVFVFIWTDVSDRKRNTSKRGTPLKSVFKNLFNAFGNLYTCKWRALCKGSVAYAFDTTLCLRFWIALNRFTATMSSVSVIYPLLCWFRLQSFIRPQPIIFWAWPTKG